MFYLHFKCRKENSKYRHKIEKVLGTVYHLQIEKSA